MGLANPGLALLSSTTEYVLPARVGISFVAPDASVLSLVRANSVPLANREHNRIVGVPEFAAGIYERKRERRRNKR